MRLKGQGCRKMIAFGWKFMAMPQRLPHFLAALCFVLVSFPAASPAVGAGELDRMLQQAKALGAPMAAVARAIELSR
jgi:hypothetical protein